MVVSIIQTTKFINDPMSIKRYKLTCAPIEDSDQPAHTHSLIRVFDERSSDSQWSNVSPGGKQLRNEFDLWNVNGIINTLGLLQS